MQPDKRIIAVNRRDVIRLEVNIVDQNGTLLVPKADNKVQFEVKGPGKLVGVENGDILDCPPQQDPLAKGFYGQVPGLDQATDKTGEIVLTARSEGLKSVTVRIKSQAK